MQHGHVWCVSDVVLGCHPQWRGVNLSSCQLRTSFLAHSSFFLWKKNVSELRSHKSLSDPGLDNVYRYFIGIKNVTELGMVMIAWRWSEAEAWRQRVYILSFSSPVSQLAFALLLQHTFRQDWVFCLPTSLQFPAGLGEIRDFFSRFCLKLWVPAKTNGS